MKYSQDAWKQLLQRIQEIPESELRVTGSKKNPHLIKCRKHTALVMQALRDTARNKGYMPFYFFLSTCK